MIIVELSEKEIKDIINGFPGCPVERLLNGINEFDGSEKSLEDLYSLLKWIQNHEGELARLRRIVERKIIEHRFGEVKV